MNKRSDRACSSMIWLLTAFDFISFPVGHVFVLAGSLRLLTNSPRDPRRPTGPHVSLSATIFLLVCPPYGLVAFHFPYGVHETAPFTFPRTGASRKPPLFLATGLHTSRSVATQRLCQVLNGRSQQKGGSREILKRAEEKVKPLTRCLLLFSTLRCRVGSP